MSNPQVIPPTNPEQEEILRERRLARMQRRKQSRRARLILWGTVGSSVILLGLIGFVFWTIQSLLNHDAAYPAINGVTCDSVMHGTYHVHDHLTIYINGKSTVIPAGVGIAPDGSCYYWLHTHTSDGIIHIEALQKQSNLALDDFLTIWHNGFSNLNFPPELTRTTGWKIWVNGKPFAGVVTSPLQTEVPMNSHDIITLEYGSPNPRPDDASTYHFPTDLPK